ncbi:MAG: hypothetical protein JWP97_1384 [Labilithrix sp.]|nr:hypothetical protein [Labilithrix sp.]
MRRGTLLFVLVGLITAGALPALEAPARADLAVDPAVAVPETLMLAAGQHAQRFEDMKRRGAFTMAGKVEQVDGDGSVSDAKEILVRSIPTPAPMDRITNVIHYTENGKDKTAEAQQRATERRAKRLKDRSEQEEARKKDLHLPFLPTERDRYVFTVAERDAEHGRVRVAFVPKVPAENAFKGSAWIDEKEGELLSMGFSLSKNPTFVDHVDITIVFGLASPLGRAPSRVSFDGRGGFLFIHKHFRGVANLSEPAVAF